MSFEDYAKSYVVQALERTPREVAPNVYVVSLFVYDEDDDPRYLTAMVGFNTEKRVAETRTDASDADEARWNFALWLQNELGVLADRRVDREGAALRQQLLHNTTLWYSDEEEDADLEAAMQKAEQITSGFVRCS